MQRLWPFAYCSLHSSELRPRTWENVGSSKVGEVVGIGRERESACSAQIISNSLPHLVAMGRDRVKKREGTREHLYIVF